MMVLKLVLATTLIASLFAGCGSTEDERSFKRVQVYCDKEKNIEYLFSKGKYAGEFSVRYDTDGFISKCQ